MPYTGRYLKPGTKVSAPTSIFSLVVAPSITPARLDAASDWYTWGHAEVAHVTFESGRWSHVTGATCETPEALRAWMAKRAEKHRRNYVFSPNAADAITLSQWWVDAEKSGILWEPKNARPSDGRLTEKRDDVTRIRRWNCSPRTTILDYSRNGIRWLWLSGSQFFDSTDSELERLSGVTCDATPEEAAGGNWYGRTPQAKCLVWLSAVIQLADWWRAHARAPFGLTGSGLALNMLRSHIRPKALCTHNDPEMHRLEREASYGGRASTWFFGDVGDPAAHATEANPAPHRSSYPAMPGPIHLVDVRSMYPFLLRECQFPTHRITYREGVSVQDCYDYSRDFGTICRVEIETDRPEYPARKGDAIVYPVGRFTTSLTGPEVLALRKHGRVTKCFAMGVYRMGNPFADTSGALIELRERCRASGNAAWETFAKLLGNGLGGKLAQRRGEWVECPNMVAMERWGEWVEAKGRGKKPAKYRAVAGHVWKYEPDKDGAGPYTFAFCYLTAWGRLHMRRLREMCPERSVVSQDTDGLWVTADGLAALRAASAIGGETAGCLRLDKTYSAARWLGPRHYWTPAGWVLAGFHSPSVSAIDLTVSDTQKGNPLTRSANAPPIAIMVNGRKSHLKIDSPGQRIDEDGWGHPRTAR